MGLFDRLRKTARSSQTPASESVSELLVAQEVPDTVLAPVTGKVAALTEVPDPVFAGEMLGKGCGIWPESEVVYAPVTGTVSAVTPTNHAVGLTSIDGIEVLIHIGIDTVEMGGRGFHRFVEMGASVQAGAPLVSFSREQIRADRHDDAVICVISNTDEFASVDVLADDFVEVGSPAIAVTRS